MSSTVPGQRIEAVRRFNRLYTKRLGLLNKGYLDSSLTLTEVRLLFELAQDNLSTAAELSKRLGLDPGNLSRLVVRLTQGGLLARKPAEADGRQKHLSLTAKGRKAFIALNRRANQEVSS